MGPSPVKVSHVFRRARLHQIRETFVCDAVGTCCFVHLSFDQLIVSLIFFKRYWHVVHVYRFPISSFKTSTPPNKKKKPELTLTTPPRNLQILSHSTAVSLWGILSRSRVNSVPAFRGKSHRGSQKQTRPGNKICQHFPTRSYCWHYLKFNFVWYISTIHFCQLLISLSGISICGFCKSWCFQLDHLAIGSQNLYE